MIIKVVNSWNLRKENREREKNELTNEIGFLWKCLSPWVFFFYFMSVVTSFSCRFSVVMLKDLALKLTKHSSSSKSFWLPLCLSEKTFFVLSLPSSCLPLYVTCDKDDDGQHAKTDYEFFPVVHIHKQIFCSCGEFTCKLIKNLVVYFSCVHCPLLHYHFCYSIVWFD